jgi:hypothetical protein
LKDGVYHCTAEERQSVIEKNPRHKKHNPGKIYEIYVHIVGQYKGNEGECRRDIFDDNLQKTYYGP